MAVLVVGLAYVMPFWGNFNDAFWPQPVREHGGRATRWAWQLYCQHVGVRGDVVVRYRLVWLAVSLVLGGLIPLAVMALLRRRPAEVGLGLPNRWGRRIILAGLAIVLPMSFVFAMERLRIPDRSRPTRQASGFQAIDLPIAVGVSVPEHLLLTGIAVALLLPGMRLASEKSKSQNVKTSTGNAETPKRRNAETGADISLACASGFVGSAGRVVGFHHRVSEWLRLRCKRILRRIRELRDRVLEWLELGQDVNPDDSWWWRGLAWWGLEPTGLGAILGGGLLFGAVHVGARPIEFATSFPGGVLLCYVTYRSGSIWPGWCVHVAQMVLVGGVLLLTGALGG